MRLAGTPSSAYPFKEGTRAFKIEKLVALTTTLFYYVKLSASRSVASLGPCEAKGPIKNIF